MQTARVNRSTSSKMWMKTIRKDSITFRSYPKSAIEHSSTTKQNQICFRPKKDLTANNNPQLPSTVEMFPNSYILDFCAKSLFLKYSQNIEIWIEKLTLWNHSDRLNFQMAVTSIAYIATVTDIWNLTYVYSNCKILLITKCHRIRMYAIQVISFSRVNF